MNKIELNTLIDDLIYIKDKRNLTFEEKETINKACNLIEHNLEKLKDN